MLGRSDSELVMAARTSGGEREGWGHGVNAGFFSGYTFVSRSQYAAFIRQPHVDDIMRREALPGNGTVRQMGTKEKNSKFQQ